MKTSAKLGIGALVAVLIVAVIVFATTPELFQGKLDRFPAKEISRVIPLPPTDTPASEPPSTSDEADVEPSTEPSTPACTSRWSQIFSVENNVVLDGSFTALRDHLTRGCDMKMVVKDSLYTYNASFYCAKAVAANTTSGQQVFECYKDAQTSGNTTHRTTREDIPEHLVGDVFEYVVDDAGRVQTEWYNWIYIGNETGYKENLSTYGRKFAIFTRG